jgi:hypothetical protein
VLQGLTALQLHLACDSLKNVSQHLGTNTTYLPLFILINFLLTKHSLIQYRSNTYAGNVFRQ